jgi:hypothetical protein
MLVPSGSPTSLARPERRGAARCPSASSILYSDRPRNRSYARQVVACICVVTQLQYFSCRRNRASAAATNCGCCQRWESNHGQIGMGRTLSLIFCPTQIPAHVMHHCAPSHNIGRGSVPLSHHGVGRAVGIKSWCPGAGSNHRHCDFQSHALPTELPGRRYRPKGLRAPGYSQPRRACPPCFAFGFVRRGLATARLARGAKGRKTNVFSPRLSIARPGVAHSALDLRVCECLRHCEPGRRDAPHDVRSNLEARTAGLKNEGWIASSQGLLAMTVLPPHPEEPRACAASRRMAQGVCGRSFETRPRSRSSRDNGEAVTRG